MWFNRKKKEQNSPASQTPPQLRYEWHGNFNIRFSATDTKVQLVEKAIEYASQIPLEKWNTATKDKAIDYFSMIKDTRKWSVDNCFYATTDKGASIFIGRRSTCRRDDNDERYFIFVDQDFIAEYTVDYINESFNNLGCKEIRVLYWQFTNELVRRDREQIRPLMEAEEAERQRKQAEQEALEAKKANDILRRL